MNRISLSDTTPSLDPGINRLRVQGRHSSAFPQLVLAALRERDGLAYWLDARNNASSYRLYDAAPSKRLLEPIRLARAFTAYQHHRLVRTLTQTAPSRTAFVVAPAIADLYRDDDIPAPEDEYFLEAALQLLDGLANALEIPILVSTVKDDALARQVGGYAVQDIDVEPTQFGYHYASDSHETQVYWGEGWFQTTIPYWVELFGAVGEDPEQAAYEAGLIDAEV